MLYKANKAISISTLCKEIWTIMIHIWKRRLSGSSGRGVWWIRSWNHLLSLRMPFGIRREALIEWQMITRVLVGLGRIMGFKSKSKLELKSINDSSKNGTRMRFIVQIARNKNSKSNWNFETLQTSDRGMITRNNTSRGKSTRPGNWTTSSWKCSRMNRVISSS